MMSQRTTPLPIFLIFLRRLVQEDDRELMAWNPMRDEIIYRVSAEFAEEPEGRQQELVIRSAQSDGGAS